MKKYIIIIFVSALCCRLAAQTDTLKLSLNQAMKLGIENRYDAKESLVNIDIAKNRLVKSNNDLLPDISANGKLSYYGQLQPSIIPAGYLGLTEPEKVTIGMKNNTALGFDLDYAIYKPGLYTNITIASNSLDLEKEKNKKSDTDIRIDICEAYDNVMLKSLQYEITRKNENRYKEYYELAKGKYDNGALLESDMLLAELDYNNAMAGTEKQKQNYLLSMQNLRYKINVPGNIIIILTDSLQTVVDTDVKTGQLPDACANRSEIKQLTIVQAGYMLQLKKAKQNNLPSLSVFANYTRLFQGKSFDYSGKFYWAPVNYAGLKLSIPLTGSIKNNSLVKEYRLKSEQADLMLKQKTLDVQYEVQDAFTKLGNARQNLLIAIDNYKLSQKVYELKKQQYHSGSFSYQNLLDTEKSLAAAEQSYITAEYDFLIAGISYQKATGNI